MTFTLILKAGAIWLLIAALAMGNGIFRENILFPMLGRGIGLPLSGLLLSAIVFATTYFTGFWLGVHSCATYFAIGLQWVLMTLAFEFIFGHYIGGKTWSDIFASFNVFTGDLMSVVIIVTFLSPWLAAKLKGLR